MTGITKFDAAVSLIGDTGSVSTVDGNDISTFYYQGCVAPDASEINAKQIELQAEWDSQEYARKRKEEYPEWDFQLDYIFHNGLEKWKSEIVEPIKDKYPKPE